MRRGGVALFLAAFLIVCGALVIFPGIDLWASALFYRPDEGFFLAGWAPFRLIRAGVPWLVALIILAAAGLLLASMLRRPVRGLDAKAAIFLLLSLAIGPGLVVNALFKDHWGRARPAQIAGFGGDKRFTPAFVPSDQCRRNCSFPAGDPAVGFSLVSAGFLVAAPRRRRRAVSGAIALGAIIGVVRIAQGGHFLSDVVASGFLVTAIGWALHRWIVGSDGLACLWRHLRDPPPALRFFSWLGLATAAAVMLAVRFLDRPLAIAFHGGDPAVERVFRFITNFGLSTGYLVIAGSFALGLGLAARRAREPALTRRLERGAWRAGFVFLAVAGAGLAGDILKPLFGRARPKLWFSDGIFGFTWHGGSASYWSFPSGHTITIVALATALSLIHPRGSWAYVGAAVLVAASRIILAEHYLSDVLGGAYLALAFVWALWAGLQRAGLGVVVQR
jgi:lipid A 4'-phosphatase